MPTYNNQRLAKKGNVNRRQDIAVPTFLLHYTQWQYYMQTDCVRDSIRTGRSGDHIPVRGGGEIFCIRPHRPWRPPIRLYNGYRVFPGGKAAGVWRSPHALHLAPRLKKEYSYISLQQCFSTVGPRPSTGPWHQLYRAARGSPGICHFSFLSNFHE